MTSRATRAPSQRLVSTSRDFTYSSAYRLERLSRSRSLRVESLEDRSLLSAVPGQAEGVPIAEPSPSLDAHFVTIHLEIQSVPVIEIKPGDANSDGFVDFQDYQKFVDHFLQPGVWADGDFNLDFIVDGADYVIWADNLSLAPAPATAEAAVPAAAAIPADATIGNSTADTALLAILSETAEPAMQETLTTAPDLVLCKVFVPRNDNNDLSPPAAVVPDADETETGLLDPSSLIQSPESLQLVAVAQAWELAANDGSTCAKTRSGTR